MLYKSQIFLDLEKEKQVFRTVLFKLHAVICYCRLETVPIPWLENCCHRCESEIVVTETLKKEWNSGSIIT
jgi:hypothetical protein